MTMMVSRWGRTGPLEGRRLGNCGLECWMTIAWSDGPLFETGIRMAFLIRCSASPPEQGPLTANYLFSIELFIQSWGRCYYCLLIRISPLFLEKWRKKWHVYVYTHTHAHTHMYGSSLMLGTAMWIALANKVWAEVTWAARRDHLFARIWSANLTCPLPCWAWKHVLS